MSHTRPPGFLAGVLTALTCIAVGYMLGGGRDASALDPTKLAEPVVVATVNSATATTLACTGYAQVILQNDSDVDMFFGITTDLTSSSKSMRLGAGASSPQPCRTAITVISASGSGKTLRWVGLRP